MSLLFRRLRNFITFLSFSVHRNHFIFTKNTRVKFTETVSLALIEYIWFRLSAVCIKSLFQQLFSTITLIYRYSIFSFFHFVSFMQNETKTWSG